MCSSDAPTSVGVARTSEGGDGLGAFVRRLALGAVDDAGLLEELMPGCSTPDPPGFTEMSLSDVGTHGYVLRMPRAEWLRCGVRGPTRGCRVSAEIGASRYPLPQIC